VKPGLLWGLGVMAVSAWLVVASPAGEPSPYEQIVKDMLNTVAQITEVLSGISDEDSAKAAAPKLKDQADKMLQLRKQAEQTKQPDKTEKDRLAKEYAPKFEMAVKKMRDQGVRVKGIPGGAEALRELAVLEEKKDAKDKKKDNK
jgi:hypothetical protein